jgi:DNA-binding NarL/FixJ family response regulator
MHPERDYAARALKAGASGYVEKASVPEELVSAIRRIVSGGKYISPAMAERLAMELGGAGEIAPHERLTDREFQVMCLLASGKGAKQIAAELFLSPSTIGTYRSRVLQKLNLLNTAELIHYALTHRLLE